MSERVACTPPRPGDARSSRPAVAPRLHRLRQVEAALERTRQQRREQDGAPAHAVHFDASPPQRFQEACRIALERGHQPRREGGGTCKANGLQQAIVVQQERIGRERESDRGETQGIHSRADELFVRDVELTQHRHDRAGPDRMRSDRLDERRQQKERPGRDECPDQVNVSARRMRGDRREQHESDDAHGDEVVGEQGRRCESGEECYRSARPHGPTW